MILCEVGCCEGCPECYGLLPCHNRSMTLVAQIRTQIDRVNEPPVEKVVEGEC